MTWQTAAIKTVTVLIYAALGYAALCLAIALLKQTAAIIQDLADWFADLIGQLLRALGEGLLLFLGWSLETTLDGVVWCGEQAANGIKTSAVFLYFVADETFQTIRDRITNDDTDTDDPSNHQGENESRQDENNEEEAQQDPYTRSLRLLGLSPGFTRAEFSRAYKRAIAKAHPDKGGNHQDAIAVNQARDIILNHHGWTR